MRKFVKSFCFFCGEKFCAETFWGLNFVTADLEA